MFLLIYLPLYNPKRQFKKYQVEYILLHLLNEDYEIFAIWVSFFLGNPIFIPKLTKETTVRLCD